MKNIEENWKLHTEKKESRKIYVGCLDFKYQCFSHTNKNFESMQNTLIIEIYATFAWQTRIFRAILLSVHDLVWLFLCIIILTSHWE